MAIERQEQTVEISRRQFLRGLLVGAGSVMVVDYGAQLVSNIAKSNRIHGEVKEAVKAQGKLPVEPEDLKYAEETENRLGSVDVFELDKTHQYGTRDHARKILAKQKNFNEAVEEGLKERSDQLPSTEDYVRDGVGVGLGAVISTGALLFMPNSSTIEAIGQSNVTPQEKPNK